MEKPSKTPSQRTQLIASVLLLSVPLLLVGGLLLRDHVAKQRQREFAAQMMAMQVADGQRRQQAIIQALEAAAQPAPIASVETARCRADDVAGGDRHPRCRVQPTATAAALTRLQRPVFVAVGVLSPLHRERPHARNAGMPFALSGRARQTSARQMPLQWREP